MLATVPVLYRQEDLTDDLWAELMPLLEQHYEEIAHFKDIPLAPDREKYAQIQANGSLRVYTARTVDADKLVGYLAVFVQPHLHYSTSLNASQDVLYVRPDQRGSRTGLNLIKFAHDQLRTEGVSVFYQHVKHREDLNIGPMLGRFLGYEQVDEVWAVRLDKEPA